MTSQPTITSDLESWHTRLLGIPSQEDQKLLYQAVPLGSRGYSDNAMDEARFQAILIVTLIQTMAADAGETHRVIILCPPSHEQWALAQLQVFARTIFNGFKKLPHTATAKRSDVARRFSTCFKHIFLASRVFQLGERPERWMSFGFKKTDPIPDWMRAALISV